jgi:hypothetical protein
MTNPWLVAGGWLSAAAGFLHLGVIAGGSDWYRFFGAGEKMARMAEQGSAFPALVTLGIATLLFTWAAYAFSGAGLIRRLPLLRLGLILITAIYLIRGLAIFPALFIRPDLLTSFDCWSSAIVLVFGIVHAVGVRRSWRAL